MSEYKREELLAEIWTALDLGPLDTIKHVRNGAGDVVLSFKSSGTSIDMTKRALERLRRRGDASRHRT